MESLLAQFELRMERRLGAIEAEQREMKAKMIVRDGPIVEELRRFEQAQLKAEENAKRMDSLTSRDEAESIARRVVGDSVQGTRGLTDFSMRVVMFGVSLGTLIFVVKGPG